MTLRITLLLAVLTSPLAAEWQNISDDLVAKLEADGKKAAWPGKSAGISVDRTTGSVYLVIAGLGLYKSTDKAASFSRCDDNKVGGRCETAFSIFHDLESARMACFMLDGKCGMSLDGGATWLPMKDVGRNWDFAAVHWYGTKSVIWALQHEAGGQMWLSTDAGSSWTKMDKDPKIWSLGVIDAQTFLLSRGEGLLRSTDQGKTWNKVSDFVPLTRVMQTIGGKHYFFARTAEGAAQKNVKAYDAFLIVSKDAGKTWEKQGTHVDAAWGPIFGKDEKHIITLGRKGVITESLDAGQTWKEITPVPTSKEYVTNTPGWFQNLAYDPNANILYISRMGAPAFKYQR